MQAQDCDWASPHEASVVKSSPSTNFENFIFLSLFLIRFEVCCLGSGHSLL
jgi:hypothetical protein